MSATFTICVINNYSPHKIRAVAVDVSLLAAEIPVELLLLLNNFPLIIRLVEIIITAPFIIKEDIKSGATIFPQKHIFLIKRLKIVMIC
jgi:hypothetical protein